MKPAKLRSDCETSFVNSAAGSVGPLRRVVLAVQRVVSGLQRVVSGYFTPDAADRLGAGVRVACHLLDDGPCSFG